ncbi:MAG: hypothetical protein R3C14_31720 [Caldilineaceae bacterium]
MDTTGIAPALIPILTASVGVERAVEIIWNYLEWVMLSFLRWQPDQLKSPQYLQFKSGTSLVFGVILGILVANFTGMRLFAFLRPNVPGLLDAMPVTWDVLITGFIIGAGSKPAHDILGIINQFKNFLSSSAIRQREAAGAATADGVLKLAQSEAQAMVDVPGVGPARIPMGPTSRSLADEDDEEQGEEQSTTDRYLEILRNRTSM